MERKLGYTCSLTGTDCPNDKCQYTGTGFGCLYVGIRTIDKRVRTQKRAGISDIEQIHKLSVEQAELRERLAGAGLDDVEVKKIRGSMMKNRLGDNGLRALNNRLRAKSWKR